MKFKFYHGTSSIFLESIKKYGLGYINPSFDFNFIEVLKYLSSIAEKNLSQNLEYKRIQDVTLAMSEQALLRINHNGVERLLNFRHSNIFLTLGKEQAIVHTVKNKYGSEILSYCIKLHNLLQKNNIEFQIPKELKQFNIVNYINFKADPILIEAFNVNEEKLFQANNGEPAKYFLNELRKHYHKLNDYRHLGYYNFENTENIQPSNLKFYKIKCDEEIVNIDFKYELTEII